MRVFVALLPSLASIEKIKPLDVQGLPFHHVSDLHMTLYFLGRRSQQQVLALMSELESCFMQVAVKWQFDAQGWFPNEQQAKVWALKGGMSPSLQECISHLSRLPSLEIARTFRPHMTLSPFPPNAIGLTMLENNVCIQGEVIFDRLALMQSVAGGVTRYQTLWQRELD